MRFRRNVFTGELEEVFDDPVSEFQELNARNREKIAWMARRGRFRNPWDTGKDHISRPLSLPPEQATPERIERENAEARRHGTGAWYDENGGCHLGTRRIRAREMRRRGRIDNDAGYSD